jgi:hypothetical protein
MPHGAAAMYRQCIIMVLMVTDGKLSEVLIYSLYIYYNIYNTLMFL